MHAEMTTALFVDSPYIVLTLDRQGAIVDANPSALRLLGLICSICSARKKGVCCWRTVGATAAPAIGK